MSARLRTIYSIALVALCCGSVFVSGCQSASSPDPLVKISGSTMGTFYEVTVSGLSAGSTAEALQEAIEGRLAEVNQQMSTYLPESEISRFNDSRSLDWFPISPGFAHVVQTALEIAELSEGAFDPTVGPLVNLWHFGPERSEFTVPSEEELARVRAFVGYRLLEVRLDPPALRKQVAEVKLDLSAIAKGYGVDQVADMLEEQGYRNVLVNIGGEIVARGTRPDERPWRLAIEKPVEGKREIQSVVPLKDRAMATSGDYRNFYELEGKRFSHTIDPGTGKPVTHSLHSVSVLAENCMRADAWATALLVVGPERAWTLAREHQLEVMLIYSDAETLLTRQSADFPIQPMGLE